MKSTEQFIFDAKKVHGNKYDYSLVNYTGAHNKIKIICPRHGIFEQKPNNHLNGQNCIKCSNFINTKNKIILFDTILKRFKEKHNGKYDYSLVNYTGAHNKIKIICPIHGIFEQKPTLHLSGSGCPFCANNIKKSNEQFIQDAIKIHGNKYDYSLVNYTGAHNKIKIICPIHGIFEQKPYSHLCGDSCSKCAKQLLGKLNTKSLDKFIEEANKIHNNKYDYSNVDYINTNIKIKIICPIHGEFKQLPYSHLQNHGCSKCSTFISKSETLWLDSLQIPKHYRNITLTLKDGSKIKPDGYDPNTNTIYEFYGDFWHGNINRFKSDSINKVINKTFIELYEKTMLREDKIKDNGYNIISIWESDFKV
jgi:hypothetical protein